MKNGSVNQTVRPKCQISMESQSCRLVVYPTQQVGSPTCNWDKQAQSTYNRGELTHLVSGMNQQSRKQATHSMGYWLVVSTPLKNMKNTSLDSYSQCFAKYKKCSKAPTRWASFRSHIDRICTPIPCVFPFQCPGSTPWEFQDPKNGVTYHV